LAFEEGAYKKKAARPRTPAREAPERATLPAPEEEMVDGVEEAEAGTVADPVPTAEYEVAAAVLLT